MSIDQKGTIQQIHPEDVYVSILKARLVRNQEGWTKWETCKRSVPPTGSKIMDSLLHILLTTNLRRGGEFADKMNINRRALDHSVYILTGMKLKNFLDEYRQMEAKEYLEKTDFEIREIAQKVGFKSSSAFVRHFSKVVGQPPLRYRWANQKSNFRELYQW